MVRRSRSKSVCSWDFSGAFSPTSCLLEYSYLKTIHMGLVWELHVIPGARQNNRITGFLQSSTGHRSKWKLAQNSLGSHNELCFETAFKNKQTTLRVGVLTDSYFNILITFICHHLNLNTLYYINIAKIPFDSHSWISRSNLFKGKWSESLPESQKILGLQRWRGGEAAVGLWCMKWLRCCKNRTSRVRLRCTVPVFRKAVAVSETSPAKLLQGTMHGTTGSCGAKTVSQSTHTRLLIRFCLNNLRNDTLPMSILSLILIFPTSGPAKVSDTGLTCHVCKTEEPTLPLPLAWHWEGELSQTSVLPQSK